MDPVSPVPSAGRRGTRSPRQLGRAPVSALLQLARRAGGCAAMQPELGSPSPRPRVLTLPAPCPPHARAHSHRAPPPPKHKQKGGQTAGRAGLRNFARHSLIRSGFARTPPRSQPVTLGPAPAQPPPSPLGPAPPRPRARVAPVADWLFPTLIPPLAARGLWAFRGGTPASRRR